MPSLVVDHEAAAVLADWYAHGANALDPPRRRRRHRQRGDAVARALRPRHHDRAARRGRDQHRLLPRRCRVRRAVRLRRPVGSRRSRRSVLERPVRCAAHAPRGRPRRGPRRVPRRGDRARAGAAGKARSGAARRRRVGPRHRRRRRGRSAHPRRVRGRRDRGVPGRAADIAVSDGVITAVGDVDGTRPPHRSTPTARWSRRASSTSTPTSTARSAGTSRSRRRRGTASPPS